MPDKFPVNAPQSEGYFYGEAREGRGVCWGGGGGVVGMGLERGGDGTRLRRGCGG